jgi:hypothetical protein
MLNITNLFPKNQLSLSFGRSAKGNVDRRILS